MSFKDRLTPKTWYLFLVIIWFIIGVHVAYLYVSFSSNQKASKGGTFIEATTDSTTNFLPYTSSDDNDKFYQSLLFNGCLYPTIEGTSISYREELCTVTTDNYQVFTISVLPGKRWSDGLDVTLNDIYFTYKTILKDNYWNISSLDAFRNIIVNANPEEETVTVTFPSPSIDNMIFFTNFILPAHHLGNEPYETYLEKFLTNPISSTCVELQQSTTDTTNTVFDLSNCTSTLLKYYQVKTFENEAEANEYINNNPTTIDMAISDLPFAGYEQNQVILNKFITLFLNTQNPRMNPELRRNLTAMLQGIFETEETETDNTPIIRDPYLFDSIPASTDLTWLTSQTILGTYNDAIEEEVEEKTRPESLPEKLVRGGENSDDQEYTLDEEIQDKQSIQLAFTKSFDKVSVTVNEGIEYFPSSYNKLAQSAIYNLNPLFRNVNQGRNVYTIKGYTGETHTDTYRFIVYYMDDAVVYPAAESTGESSGWDPIEIIYYTDTASQAIVDAIQVYLKQNDISGYFTFKGFADANTFEGKIMSQDYDIVIRSINMGLRKDISNLFTSSVATINPSGYVNQTFADLINRYFLAGDAQKPAIKKQIDTLYAQDVPLIILGKELGSISIRESLDFPYPERLYVLGRRRDFIDKISIFQHVDIDWDKVFQLDNFFAFLGQYW